MAFLAKHSDFDTQVFGRRVGTLELSAGSSIRQIRKGNQGYFDVVFVKCEGWVIPDDPVVALDYRYDMENSCPKVDLRTSDESNARLLDHPLPGHLDIVKTAFADSRFLLDPKLASSAPDFYTIWLSHCRKVYALAPPEDQDAFLALTQDPDGSLRISLVATREGKRGKDLGSTLIRSAFYQEEIERWRVKVSARNYRAIAFYEWLGFHMKSVSTAFHVWMEE